VLSQVIDPLSCDDYELSRRTHRQGAQTLGCDTPGLLCSGWTRRSPRPVPVLLLRREGGRCQLEGNAGGTVTYCDRPHGFEATWEIGGDVGGGAGQRG
jgi:hypothetical protein